MKHIVNLLLILLLVLVYGNSPAKNNPENNNSNTDNAGIETSEVSVDEWLGSYVFRDVLDRRYTDYFLTIYKENNTHYATLTTYGYQIQTNLKAKLKVEGQSANLIFDSFLPENEFDEPLNVGDIVLTLHKKGANLHTNGGKVMLIGNTEPEDIYFKSASDITMDEAVDILRKKLNDKTMKYLLGEDSESEMVYGEKTHYIRAFHEGAGGAIGTFGHFYIGRQSGKIYFMDIVNGVDIVPY